MRVETATLQMESRTRVHRIRRSNPLTVSLILLVLLCGASPSRGAATTDDTRLPLHGVSPDRFVQGAPLTVAAVCRDGVALLAAHAPDDDEPLLYHRHFDENGVDERPNQDSTENSPAFQDLPSDFGGPFRIHPIDGTGTVLASTGWRADCERLVAVAQSLASSERLRYGPPDIGQIYPQYLATELSLYMAQCAASEGVSFFIVRVTIRLDDSSLTLQKRVLFFGWRRLAPSFKLCRYHGCYGSYGRKSQFQSLVRGLHRGIPRTCLLRRWRFCGWWNASCKARQRSSLYDGLFKVFNTGSCIKTTRVVGREGGWQECSTFT